MQAPLKEKPLIGESWSRPWHLFFNGLSEWVSSLIRAIKFKDLSDVPQSYTGQAGKVVAVKGTEDGLEFIVGGGGTSVHNNLTGLQGGTAGEYFHLSSADSTEAVAFLNGGSATHTQLDSERTSSIAHRADSTIHFTEGSIDHTAISNVGTNSHAQIDTHISNTDIHKLVFDENEYSYTGNLNTGIVIKNSGSTLKTITKTYDSSNRVATVSNGIDTWILSYDGAGFYTGAIKT